MFEIDDEIENFIEAVNERWRVEIQALREGVSYWQDHCATIHAENLKLKEELDELRKQGK